MRVPVRLILGLIILVGVGFVVLYINGPDGTPAGGGDTPAAVQGTDSPAAHPPPDTPKPPPPGVEPPLNPPKGDGPTIHFEETEYRFGNVREGEVVEHTFAVENRGKALLVIKELTGDCGCTDAVASSKEIAPGKSGEIQTAFRSDGYPGQQIKKVYVDSNDPANPRVELTLTGFVARDLALDPSYIYFDSIAPDAAASRTVSVASLTDTPFRILSVKPSSPHIHCSKPKASDDKHYEFEVTIGPGLPTGQFSGEVVVTTDSGYYPQVRVLLFANVTAAGKHP